MQRSGGHCILLRVDQCSCQSTGEIRTSRARGRLAERRQSRGWEEHSAALMQTKEKVLSAKRVVRDAVYVARQISPDKAKMMKDFQRKAARSPAKSPELAAELGLIDQPKSPEWSPYRSPSRSPNGSRSSSPTRLDMHEA